MIDQREQRHHPDCLDSQFFKAFYWAARELNFTRASRKAAMTQSGISQHIARLEQQLGTKLFERINKRVTLTQAGQFLLNFIEQQSDALNFLREQLTIETRKLSGPVSYAMPHSCLFTPHFPLLLRKRRQYSDVLIHVELCPNRTVIQYLIEKKIDFGFVTRRSNNPAIAHELFARERYQLFGAALLDSVEMSPAVIKQIPFVDYPGMETLFDIWREKHLPRAKGLTADSLNIVGSINSLHGAVTMLLEGVGYTVMPSHCAEPWLGKKKIKAFCPLTMPVEAGIFIVTLRDQRPSARVERVIESFREMR